MPPEYSTATAFAELIGIKVEYLRKLERKKSGRRITRKLAEKVSKKTGVDAGWLVNGDIEKPIGTHGHPYRTASSSITTSNAKKQTTIAILRALVPREHGSIECFSEILGISVSYLQKLESGLKPITADIADRAYRATGVSCEWLSQGSTALPPTCFYGLPYTAKSFERHVIWQRSLNETPPSPDIIAKLALGGCKKIEVNWKRKVPTQQVQVEMSVLAQRIDEVIKEELQRSDL